MDKNIINLLKESLNYLSSPDYDCDYCFEAYKGKISSCPCKHPEQKTCKIRYTDSEDFNHTELNRQINCNEPYLFMWDFEQYLRSLYKYESDRLDKLTGNDLIEEIRDKYFEMKGERNLHAD